METTSQIKLEKWVIPEVIVLSVKEETLGLNGIHLEEDPEYMPSS